MKQSELDPLVEEIVRKSIKPAVTVSIRDIAREVARLRKVSEPSPSQIKYSLDRLGIKAQGHRWIYRHNEAKHD